MYTYHSHHFACAGAKVVNPQIHYWPLEITHQIDGVAVNMIALMAVLDECGISHPKGTL